jgi:hypothetical protein
VTIPPNVLNSGGYVKFIEVDIVRFKSDSVISEAKAGEIDKAKSEQRGDSGTDL